MTLTYGKEAMLYLDKEIENCKKHINGSDNPDTRYKWMERQSMFEELQYSLKCLMELEDYRNLDMLCYKKYGKNISRQLNL